MLWHKAWLDTRWRFLTGLVELFVLIVGPALLLAGLAPAIGEQYAVVDAVVHGVCVFAVATVFFGLTFWLATTFSDVWRPGLIACAVAMGLALCETVLGGAVPFGLFQVARAESYFREARVPWVGLLFASGLAVALVHRAIVAVERQDF